MQEDLRDIKKLLRENLEYNKKIFEYSKKTKNYILWLKIINLIKVVVIVLPIVLALIYIPPLLTKYLGGFGETLESLQGLSKNSENINSVIKQFLR